MLRIALAMVARKPGHQGERGVSRKTTAQGMPGRSGEPVVTTLVCLSLSHARLRVLAEHPAFPAPSVFKGVSLQHSSGVLRREDAEAWL